MKKFLAILLAFILLFSLCACGKTGNESNKSSAVSSEDNTTAFVKPDNYASVLLVTINPQIKLYLDKDNSVLAVEPVNDDAKSVVENLDVKNKKVDAAVESIIKVSNDKGFVKENAEVKFEVAEKKVATVDENTLLSVARNSAAKTATDLKISFSMNAGPVFTQSSIFNDDPNRNDKANDKQHNKNEEHTLNFTSVKDMVGEWKIRYQNAGELYDFYLVLYGNSENWRAKAKIGDHFRTLPEETWEDIRKSPEYAEFKGQEYYMAKGSGRAVVNFIEKGEELTITDAEGDILSLRRLDENTFLIGKSSPNFADVGRLPVGQKITFSAK